MDHKTVHEKSKALQKAQASGEPASVITGLLNELKKGVVANEELLRSTKIGVTVARAKQHKDPQVARLAADIVRKWREEVEKHRGGSSGAGAAGAKKGSVASPRTPTATESGADKAKGSAAAAAASTVPPDQRSWKKDKVDTARTGSQARNNCIGLLYDGLVFQTTAAPDKVLAAAQAVEAATFGKVGPEDKPAYKAKVRQLFQNLKAKGNSSLRVQVVSGDVTAARLVGMSDRELQSDDQRRKDEQMQKENLREAHVPKEEKSESKELQCGKCGQRRVAYSQAQTRSADEPMTTFCECLNCGKRWKFS